MRWRIRRRSVSSLVSPGPRVPMPPPSRDSAVARADEPRQQVLQLRELDLQLAFARPGAAREDVEDQLRAVDDLAAERLLEVAQLRRAQLVVEDDDVDAQLVARRRASALTLPLPRNVAGSGLGRSCSTRSTTVAPAAAARPASSSSECSGSTWREELREIEESDERRTFADRRSRASSRLRRRLRRASTELEERSRAGERIT